MSKWQIRGDEGEREVGKEKEEKKEEEEKEAN